MPTVEISSEHLRVLMSVADAHFCHLDPLARREVLTASMAARDALKVAETPEPDADLTGLLWDLAQVPYEAHRRDTDRMNQFFGGHHA
jgi:hypothetical protein